MKIVYVNSDDDPASVIAPEILAAFQCRKAAQSLRTRQMQSIHLTMTNTTTLTLEDRSTVRPEEIAMLCNGDEVYGIGTIIKLYAKGSPNLRFVCFSDGPLYQSLQGLGADVILGHGLNSFIPRGTVRTLMRMPALLKQTCRDAEILHDQLKPLGIKILHTHRLAQQLISGQARRFGYRTVWQINNNMNRRGMGVISQRLNWRLARWGADLLLPASDFIADHWQGSGVPMTTIRNAAEPIVELSHPGSPPPLRCLVAGRIDPTKGHHTAIDAVILAREAGHDITLDIFGGPLESNSYADRLRQRVEETNSGEAIRFMGFCSDLRQKHGEYHVGLQCRIDPEPCSLWVCETMVDGLPLIASATGGTPELVKDGVTGYLYPAGDAKALATHLQSLTQTPSRAVAMRTAAHARGHKYFTLNRFIENTFAAYATTFSL